MSTAICIVLVGTCLRVALPQAASPVQEKLGANEPPRFEVLVLGTGHAPTMFWGPGYTAAHIRATLDNARPDVIAVESHPTWFAHNRFHAVTYEAQGVAVPYAREKGLPCYGADWKDIAAWDRLEERGALKTLDHMTKALERTSVLPLDYFGAYRQVPEDSPDWAYFNEVEGDELRRSVFGAKSPGDEDFAIRRDREIAANCLKIMEQHPGKRIAVIFGAHHKPTLEILLGRVDGVSVLKLGRDVAVPTPKQIERAWTSIDLVNTLAHSLDSGRVYFDGKGVDREWTQRLLRMLEERGDHDHAVRYFRARLHTIAGDYEAAERELDALIEAEVDGVLYPFPLRVWRMRYSLAEAVRVEKARLLLERGEKDAAAKSLDLVHSRLDHRLKLLELTRPREWRQVDAIADWNFDSGDRGVSKLRPCEITSDASTHNPRRRVTHSRAATGSLGLLGSAVTNVGDGIRRKYQVDDRWNLGTAHDAHDA